MHWLRIRIASQNWLEWLPQRINGPDNGVWCSPIRSTSWKKKAATNLFEIYFKKYLAIKYNIMEGLDLRNSLEVKDCGLGVRGQGFGLGLEQGE